VWRNERELAQQSARVLVKAAEVERLAKVAHALQTDPDYVRAVASQRTRVDAVPADPTSRPPLVPVASSRPWYQPVAEKVAGDSLLRARLLLLAASLVVFGFTFLHARERGLRENPAGH
jgi:hypothetical protein